MDNVVIREFIDKELLYEILRKYYSIKFKKDVYVKEDISVKYNDISAYPDLKLSLVDKNNIEIKVILNYQEIFNPLRCYINVKGYELIEFKYDGGTRNRGFYTDDKAFFNGVWISYYASKKALIRSLFKRW